MERTKSAQNNSLLLNSTPNLELLVNQFKCNTRKKFDLKKISSSKYYDLDEMHNFKISSKKISVRVSYK